VHAGIDNRKVVQGVGLILKELGKIKAGLVHSDEFKRAKEFYLGQMMLALEDTLDHMLWIGESTTALDKTYSLEEIVKELNLVKREDISEVARRVFREENLNLALIGPLKHKEKQIYRRLHIA
jgi:predicted Zn-dependent peptidase